MRNLARALPVLTVLAALFVAAVPLDAGVGNKCSPAGTWYGGAEGGAKYLMTITPRGGNRFTVIAQGGYSLEGVGYVANTSFAGELAKTGPGRYLARMMAFLATDYGIPPAVAEIDAASGTMEMTSCTQLISTIDFFVAYFDPNANPFEDPYNLDLLQILHGGEPIVETYTRISMAPID